MKAGSFDRPIVIEQATSTQDTMGQDIQQSWSTFHACYAQWKPLMGNERFRASGLHAVESGAFGIRYKEGILPTMRITFDNKYYKITGIAEDTRRRNIEITVERWL